MPEDSKNVAKVVIIENDKILVLNRADNGKYDLPGGHLHIGEHPINGIIREVYEETKIFLLNAEEIIKYKKKRLYISKNFDYTRGKIELDLKENSKYSWMTNSEFLKIDDDDATDVITAYKAYLRDEKEFWTKFR
tara:strand:+ start:256 stop:660 length:405 start_codon:yes stop_codon:yes gene_type:complete